jgi:hypothetical protein
VGRLLTEPMPNVTWLILTRSCASKGAEEVLGGETLDCAGAEGRAVGGTMLRIHDQRGKRPPNILCSVELD